MRILGIETSADETAAAVVQDGFRLLSNEVASSMDLHTAYGGMVPEIAARSHIESILAVIDKALKTAETSWENIDAIAVTRGPGLIGSLLVGVLTARTLAIAKNKPLFGVNHVAAHVYANFLSKTSLPGYILPAQAPAFPLLALIVSGGHSQLVLFKNHQDYHILGQTRDDAIGEAFDKVAKILGLPYPGGPSVYKAALRGNPAAVRLPIAQLASPYDFSFSGLKTAVLRASQAAVGKDFTLPSHELPELLKPRQVADLAASFQFTAIKTVVNATLQATGQFKPKSVVLAGGVAASQALRLELEAALPFPPIYPDIKLCTDNAAMIAAAAFYQKSVPADPYNLAVFPNLSM